MPFPNYLKISGSPYELGFQHGQAIGTSLRDFLEDGTSRLKYLCDFSLTESKIPGIIDEHKAIVLNHLPALALEIEGLAAGANISNSDAWLLQLRREILGYNKMTSGDCSTFAVNYSEPILAQTVDLNGNLDDYISVLNIQGPSRQSILLSFGGLLGYLGMNDAGVGVGINLVLGGDWGPGIPPYLAIRHVLDTSSSVDEAIEIFRSLPLSSSRSFTVCDKNKSVAVEVLGRQLRVLDCFPVAHTNHFLHPEFISGDQLNPFARNSSIKRLKAISELAVSGCSDPEDIMGGLSSSPLCVNGIDDIRRERTVCAVVMYLDRGEMYLRPGDPSRSSTSRFCIGEVSNSVR